MSPSEITLKVLCPPSEISEEFLQGMVNRMTVSFFKYGEIADAYPSRVDALACLQQRLDSYRSSGNTEYLIDAANFAMIEFLRPSIEGARFVATDSDGSPGRVTVSGSTTSESNEALQ